MNGGLLLAAALLAGASATILLTRSEKMKPDTGDEQELLGMEREFGDHITHRNIGAMDRLLAEDFVGINNLGQELTKAQVLADFSSSDYDIDLLVNEDIRVRVFGNAAVATARGRVKGRYKGRDASGQFRYTRVWIKRHDRWQAVAAQSTSLPQP